MIKILKEDMDNKWGIFFGYTNAKFEEVDDVELLNFFKNSSNVLHYEDWYNDNHKARTDIVINDIVIERRTTINGGLGCIYYVGN